MITPLEQAKDAYERWNPREDFTTLVALYLARGFVYSGDDAFILAMPTTDAWFVHLAAGDLRRFQALAPYPKPFIAWQRRGGGPVRRYRWDRFAALTLQTPKTYGLDRIHTRPTFHGRGRPRYTPGAD